MKESDLANKIKDKHQNIWANKCQSSRWYFWIEDFEK